MRFQFGVFFALSGFDLREQFAVLGDFGGFFFFLFFFFVAFGRFGARFRPPRTRAAAAAHRAGGKTHRQHAEQHSRALGHVHKPECRAGVRWLRR